MNSCFVTSPLINSNSCLAVSVAELLSHMQSGHDLTVNLNSKVRFNVVPGGASKRYRIHDTTVFGKPDISNKKKEVVIFIDGCFWHGCKKCYEEPKTNTDFWRKKILTNRRRREEVVRHLKRDGWMMLQFWEHEIRKNPYAVVERILKVL